MGCVCHNPRVSGHVCHNPQTATPPGARPQQETEQLMIEAMGEHIALLRESGEPVPEPSDSDSVTVLDPSAA
jgi:hypothetical protein